MDIDKRKELILEAIIRDYVETAEPVGSRSIVRKHRLKVSPATVRNEMSDLEEMGLLEQPHTSAGRIPSERGFRYYVDCLMVKEELNQLEKELLYRMIADKISDVNEVIQRVSSTLSRFTRYASFIVAAPITLDEIKSVQLMEIEPGKALLIAVTASGIILHQWIDIPGSITGIDLDNISTLFTETFQETRPDYLTRTFLASLRDELWEQRQLVEVVLDSLNELLRKSEEERVILSGALNILSEPEFRDLEKLKTVLGILQEEAFLKQALNDTPVQEITIKIGKENKLEEIKELSLIFTGYKIDGQEMGKMGVIGPVRMEYWKAASWVESLRDVAEDLISKLLK